MGPLSGEFPPVSTRQWEDKIREDLQGEDYDKKLVWETHDGYRIRPYYRCEDLGGIDYLESLPGQFPYLRSGKTQDNAWLIRQDIPVKDLEKANAYAKEILSRGITALGFDLRESSRLAESDIHPLLKGLPLDEVPLNFMLDEHFTEVLEYLHSFLERNDIDPSKITGSLQLDPLGQLTATGNFRGDMEGDFAELVECLEYVRDNLPGIRVIHSGGNVFHNAGASVSQELAFTLAMGNEYLVQLREMGIRLEDIPARMQFCFPVGSSYFMEIAKLRAARFLWSRILQAHSPKADELSPMFIQTLSSRWNQTLYDPHVNMLRGTTAAMSAIIGGTDSHTVLPFDDPLSPPGPFSDRAARNSQIILKEESYLDKVIDPAAGSYYIENLTDTLINGAWEIFLQTENKGGYRKSLIEGFIQEKVKKTAGTRLANLATRREMLLGINRFPILDERIDGAPPAAGPAIDPEECIVEPLVPSRESREFEELRLRTDRHAGKRPVVFIIPLGNLAMRRARAMFSMNFFACAGFEVIDNIGRFKTVREGTDDARRAGADIVVLCSSDDEYPGMAADLVEGAGGDIIPVIAGYPAEHIDSLKKAGIRYFIHARSNLLKELKNYQQMMGI